MNRVRPVSGGGRAVEVDADRITGWYGRFAQRHGGVRHTELSAGRVVVEARDGSTASVAVPFAPLTLPDGEDYGFRSGLSVHALVTHMVRGRRIGIALIRLGGHSVGVVETGEHRPRIVISATGRKPVHGRAAAGGWSQQRFARRREGQARIALRAAGRDVVRVLGSRLGDLDAVVLGGDGRALEAVRAEPGVAEVFALAQQRVLDVPEPRLAVLVAAAVRACGVEIVVTDALAVDP
jgi:hypothetical protein